MNINQKGQTSVEYILLLAVIVSLVTAVMNSQSFQEYLGDGGRLASVYKDEIEFSYTNSYQGREAFEQTSGQRLEQHKSYLGPSNSRFFGAAEAYPQR